MHVAVVGAGIIGLTAAVRLRAAGHAVTLIAPELDAAGRPHAVAGATHAAAGMLAPLAETQFSQDDLAPLLQAGWEAYPALVGLLADRIGRVRTILLGQVVLVASALVDALGSGSATAVGVGLFRSEFLFMGRQGHLPDEEEQYLAYRRAVEGMDGLPVTIRTVDVGADKPMDSGYIDGAHLNPALGLRAIRWSLADPAMFRTQLRAVLRAAAHGRVNLLFPMIAHTSEIQQTLAQVELAREELDARGVA